MISTGRNKTCLIFSRLGEQFSFIQSFLLVETIIKTWRPIFKEKVLCSWQKLFFWVVFFFSIIQIFLAVKTVSLLSGNVFFNELFIPASKESTFFIQNFAEAFEIWRCQFLLVETDLMIFWLVELIFPICQILLLVKAIF